VVINLSLEFDYYSLGDLVKIKYGKNQKKVQDDENGKYPIYGTGGLMGYSIDYLYDKPSVLIGRKGSIEKVRYIEEPFWTVDTLFYTEVNEKIVIPKFLYYMMSLIDLSRYNEGTSIPSLRTETLNRLDFPIPNLDYQNRVLSILSSVDKKIEINEKINKNLFNIASSIQTEWMINFTPFKSEKFKTSSFGLIPENWNVGKLGDVIELLDSKRIPLSGQQRENMEKIYPYYGAASLMDYVEDYIFDGVYLLMGEDGTVVDDKGFPILQYVWGKFWVNNHAHILKGKNGFNVESLYLLLSKTNIQSIVTGAVQAKVNQSNLKSIEIIIPPVDVMEKFNKLIKPFFDTIRSNNDEIKELQKLRDTLLPKLMSGEIDVSKINCDLLIKILEFLFFMIIN